MLSTWLNHARIRRQALLLGICLWLVYAINLATPSLIDRGGHLKGADFLHPYVLGSLANEHRPAALYDAAAQIEQGTKLVPESKDVWFVPVYPPQYALFFAPFARLSYVWAFAAWSLVTALIYLAGCYLLSTSNTVLTLRRNRRVPHSSAQPKGGSSEVISNTSIELERNTSSCHSSRSEESLPAPRSLRSTLLILTLAFPGFVTLVMFGQNSILAFATFTLMYLALRSRRPFLAGLALGLLAYKPQLALVAAFVFVVTVEWRIILGALVSLAAQLAAVMSYFGTGVMKDYWHALTHLSQYASILEPKPYLMHCLRAFWTILLPWHTVAIALYALTAIAVLVLTIRIWRRLGPTPLSFSALILATILVAPHLTVYDLALLAAPLLFAGDWLLAHPDHHLARRLGLLLYFSYWVALLGPLTRLTHVQLSVPIFAALLLTLSTIPDASESRSPRSELTAVPTRL